MSEFMRLRLQQLLVLSGLLFAGCAKPDNIVFWDKSGKQVAAGYLEIPAATSGDRKLSGKCRFHSITIPELRTAFGKGKYDGHVKNGMIYIDLAPNMADHNIVLQGKIQNGVLKGEWFHATDAGDQRMGSFSATVP